ncbi:hypothetical protein EVAR_98747_1 [Eumeta japonica]|uniref:Uncharacterized protein n=1 Tax=Eumeta variegata TaxID=151549 RepID=A0A4C1YYX9_EUMVA|nr:hypothetical protein EVAR_98747_1 [Eumeta japonica]
MDINLSSGPITNANDAQPSSRGSTNSDSDYGHLSAQVAPGRAHKMTSTKSTAPPKLKAPVPSFCAKEERKLKAVIRGIPVDFTVDNIKVELRGQGFSVHSVIRRDDSPLWLAPKSFP